MKTTRYFGKCKACKAPVVVNARQGNVYPMPVGGKFVDNVHCMSSAFTLMPFHVVVSEGYVLCKCGVPCRTLKALSATFSDKHVCGAKCLNSKGPSCECSCGGANHGSGHVAA